MPNTFNHFAEKILLPFAEQFPIQFIRGKNNCQLSYRHFVHSSAVNKLVILVNGREENILKWTEPAWQFYQQGYDVLVMDHRGQGYSQRLLINPQKGYVDEFRYYVDDLDLIVKTVTQSFDYQQQFLLGHSMGSLISTYYLANCDHQVQKAVLSAPFYGVPTKYPRRDFLITRLMVLLSQGERYIFNYGDYKPRIPHNTPLTHSKSRQAWFNAILQKNPILILGGATFRWLYLCWQAQHQLPKILPKITIPINVLQAEKEQIVNNNQLVRLVALLPKGELRKIANAKHEILFEKKAVREQVFAEIFDFFAKN